MINNNRTDKKIIIEKQTWFGLKAFIEIHPGFFHRTGLGNVIIPHPPLINWLLRIGLTKNAGDSLTITHEFGHLQSLPQAVIYFLLIAYFAASKERLSWLEIVFLFLNIFSVWEIMAEIFTAGNSSNLYKEYYTGVSVLPRIIFWTAAIFFFAGGWILLLG